MKKDFNITGVCLPDRHYMADVSKKLEQTINMVDKGEYFIINRPRQYGKTTTFHTIAKMLRETGDYVVFRISFEGVGDSMFETEQALTKGFVEVLATNARNVAKDLELRLIEAAKGTNTFKKLKEVIADLANQTDKRVVLMIDEVDKSSNNQLFVSFLAMLRDMYLERSETKTFHSVVLAGVHDVKTLKLKLRPDEERKFNSPWNIAAKYKVDMNLQASEIEPMLKEYCEDKGVEMDIKAVAERLFYHTSGYPFLVSHLCKTIDEDILPTKTGKTWTFEDIEESAKFLLKESNTNFDSLITSLENNKALYDFVYRIIMEGEIINFNSDEPLIELGLMHGIFKNDKQIKIHNRIYEQRLYDYMTAKTIVSLKKHYNYAGHFVLDDDTLDMPAVLLKFQQFMKEEFNEKDETFLGKNGRLVFLSFLSPILNGKGHSFKEVQTSEEKRLDIIATYNDQKYIIELKRWYGESYHEKGIKQLSNYLDIHGLRTGFLVVFEYNTVKSGRKEWIERDGKRIFAVWV